MATGLEFYKNSNLNLGQNATTTYSPHTTCAVDRSTKSDTRNFFVIAHISTTIATAGITPKIRLYLDDAITLGEVSDGLRYSANTAGHGFTYNFVKRVSLDDTNHNVKIQFALSAGSDPGTFDAENSSIMVLEESAYAEYAEITTPAVHTNAAVGSYVDAVTLTFTPPGEGNLDYLFMWAGELMLEDESNADTGGIRFYNSTDAQVYMANDWGELVDANNDGIYFTQGGACYDTIEPAQHTVKLQIQGGGAADEAYLRNAAIVAIPFSDFENVYNWSQVQTRTNHTGPGWSDSNIAEAQAVNTADHLVISACAISNESPQQTGIFRMVVDATNIPGYNFDDRDEDTGEWYCYSLGYGVALEAGIKAFEIEGSSSGVAANVQGVIYDAYMIVAEIPQAAVTYTEDMDASGVVAVADETEDLDASGIVETPDLTEDLTASGVVAEEFEEDLPASGVVKKSDLEEDLLSSGAVKDFDLTETLSASGAAQTHDLVEDLSASGAVETPDLEEALDAGGVVEALDEEEILDASGAIQDPNLTEELDASGIVETPNLTETLPSSGAVNAEHTEDLSSGGAVQSLGLEEDLAASGAVETPGLTEDLIASGAVEDPDQEEDLPASGIVQMSDEDEDLPSSGIVKEFDNTEALPGAGAINLPDLTEVLPASGVVENPGLTEDMLASGVVTEEFTEDMPSSGIVVTVGDEDLSGSGAVRAEHDEDMSASGLIAEAGVENMLSSGAVKAFDLTEDLLGSGAVQASGLEEDLSSSAVVENPDLTEDIDASGAVEDPDLTEDLLSSGLITSAGTESINASGAIKTTENKPMSASGLIIGGANEVLPASGVVEEIGNEHMSSNGVIQITNLTETLPAGAVVEGERQEHMTSSGVIFERKDLPIESSGYIIFIGSEICDSSGIVAAADVNEPMGGSGRVWTGRIKHPFTNLNTAHKVRHRILCRLLKTSIPRSEIYT